MYEAMRLIVQSDCIWGFVALAHSNLEALPDPLVC